MLKQKLSDKFSNIFSRERKEKQEKQEQGRKDQNVYFNESYFQCKLVYNPHKLSLIKVIANILVGADAGTPMMVSCKWLIKKNGQYSEIQGVTSSCYQPCIEDVGCSVLVQITPLIEGKIYSGATITKQTGPLELGSVLETIFTERKTKLYYQQESIEFMMKIEAVFGKECEYSNLDYPQEGKLTIRKQVDSNFEIEIITAQFKAYFWITKEFPVLQFIRKSYNSVVISFTQFQSMRLAFKQGSDREILALLLRTLTANSTLDWPKDSLETIAENGTTTVQNQENVPIQIEKHEIETTEHDNKPELGNLVQHSKISQGEPQNELTLSLELSEKKETKIASMEELRSQSTIQQKLKSSQDIKQNSSVELQMRIGELNIEVNKIKKEYRDLMKNYNLEKQNKCKLEHQVKKYQEKMCDYQKIQKENFDLVKKNEKLNEDNRFYRNEATLLNKNMKKKQSQLQLALSAKETFEMKLHKYQTAQTQLKKPNGEYLENILKNESDHWKKLNTQLADQNDELKQQIENLQNSLATANRKLESLYHQKVISNSECVKSDPVIPIAPDGLEMAEKQKTIKNLMFKISNLEMLLKHRSGERGNETLALHKIINSLTEDITEKSEQLEQVKKINKELMDRIRALSAK